MRADSPTRPGSQYRHSPGIWDGERQMPMLARNVVIIRRPGTTSPSGPGMRPGHAGDPGTMPSVLALHDHLLSAMTDPNEQSVINSLQSAHNANFSRLGCVQQWKTSSAEHPALHA